MGKFTITKALEVAGSHCLQHLPYPSKCKNTHGHNWKIKVTCQCDESELDPNTDMVIDFTHIKKIAMEMDHQHLNDFVKRPTAENIAKHICLQIEHCIKVEVEESEGNIAIFEV